MNAKNLMDILHSGRYSLIINNKELHAYTGRGISDLYKIYNQDKELLHGASVADKIVGKGAAALMALGYVSEVITDVVSSSALSLLVVRGISVSFQKVVPNIINRKGDGICPVEERCMECRTPEVCLPFIERFMSDNN